jgi:ATP-dependent DNA helicase PIF1
MSNNSNIFSTIFNEKSNIFLSGTGGCGKSYTLKAIYETAKEKQIKVEITSTTGISAYQIKGRTVHSWAGFIFPSYIESEEQFNTYINRTCEKIKRSREAKKRWMETELLLIDEVSMLGGNYLDILNSVAKYVRKNSLPFGGIQVVLSGDLLQLPPVKDIQVFESLAWEDFDLKYYVLSTPWRFNDTKYIELLKRIRLASHTAKDIKLLESRRITNFDNDYINNFLKDSVYILPKKNDVNKYNKTKLEELKADLVICSATDTEEKKSFLHEETNKAKIIKELKAEENTLQSQVYSQESTEEIKESKDNSCCICLNDFKKGDSVKYLPCFHLFHTDEIDSWLEKNNACPICRTPVEIKATVAVEKTKCFVEEDKEDNNQFDKLFPVAKYLNLKAGCKVMLLINIDVNLGLINGSVGTVLKVDSQAVKVCFTNGITIDIPPHDFEYEDYNTVLKRRQFPLTLAYAVSIHKSQGSTIERMIVDLGSNIFAEGQAYVALSRCKNLEGLLIKNLDSYKIKSNKQALQFEKSMMKKAVIC